MRDTSGKAHQVPPARSFCNRVHHKGATGRGDAAIKHEIIGQAEILHLHAIGIFPGAIGAPMNRTAQMRQAPHGEIPRRIAVAQHRPTKRAHEAKLIRRAGIGRGAAKRREIRNQRVTAMDMRLIAEINPHPIAISRRRARRRVGWEDADHPVLSANGLLGRGDIVTIRQKYLRSRQIYPHRPALPAMAIPCADRRMDAEREYNNRARVPESAEIIAAWARDAATFRASGVRAELDLAYGEGAREKLDLFLPPDDRAAPTALFIHGGYWQALDRSFVSHCARGLLGQGVAVAVPSYDLCPAVTLGEIAEQMRRAAAFLHRRRGGRLLAAGHSAGGQLAALLVATDWPAFRPGLPVGLVGAALPVSGVFELGPLKGTSIAKALNLTGADIATLSPRLLPPPAFEALHVVVGGAESDEFIRQSRDFAIHWGGSFEALPGANHFTVLDPFTDPAHPLMIRAGKMAHRLALRPGFAQ
jgi:arylformamidase